MATSSPIALSLMPRSKDMALSHTDSLELDVCLLLKVLPRLLVGAIHSLEHDCFI